MDPWLYGLCFSPDKCCLQVGRMLYLLCKRVPSSMSISATVTVGTWIEQLNDFKTASSSMFRNGYDSTQPPMQRVQPNRTCKRKQPAPECDSAIGQHLLENDQCAANYNDDQFAILDTARSYFRLNLLEASYIKVRRPNLCKQKEFVYTHKLFK